MRDDGPSSPRARARRGVAMPPAAPFAADAPDGDAQPAGAAVFECNVCFELAAEPVLTGRQGVGEASAPGCPPGGVCLPPPTSDAHLSRVRAPSRPPRRPGAPADAQRSAFALLFCVRAVLPDPSHTALPSPPSKSAPRTPEGLPPCSGRRVAQRAPCAALRCAAPRSQPQTQGVRTTDPFPLSAAGAPLCQRAGTSSAGPACTPGCRAPRRRAWRPARAPCARRRLGQRTSCRSTAEVSRRVTRVPAQRAVAAAGAAQRRGPPGRPAAQPRGTCRRPSRRQAGRRT